MAGIVARTLPSTEFGASLNEGPSSRSGNRQKLFRSRKIWNVLQYARWFYLRAGVCFAERLRSLLTAPPAISVDSGNTNVQTRPTTLRSDRLENERFAADSVVNYGTGLPTDLVRPLIGNGHEPPDNLSGLAAGTTYYYQVSSTD